ncbi:DoxX family protein [Nocardia sp. NPDC006044]|uniref:DoxX family protein n=1 Tax=Nocardia sp. NPDC006044 TaxID=3364306 RepID=UPI0036AD544B
MAVATARVGLGVVFLFEATQKLFGWWSGSPTGSGHPEPLMSWPYWWAGVAELALGLTLTAGWHTRASALLGAGTMAYAYLFEHMHIVSPDMFDWRPMENGGAFAAVYGFAFLLLFAAPTDTFSLDYLIARATDRRQPSPEAGDPLPGASAKGQR